MRWISVFYCVLWYTAFVEADGDVPPCASKWVHGYSQGSNYPGQEIFISDTPTTCQQACQRSDACFVWMFDSASKKCTLKVEAQIKGAVDIELPLDLIPTNEYYEYCPHGMPYMCHNGYNCATCSSEMYRCVWW
eukprot:Lankesteria_metandrocarpae@DN5068_c1_g1_i3.p1